MFHIRLVYPHPDTFTSTITLALLIQNSHSLLPLCGFQLFAVLSFYCIFFLFARNINYHKHHYLNALNFKLLKLCGLCGKKNTSSTVFAILFPTRKLKCSRLQRWHPARTLHNRKNTRHCQTTLWKFSTRPTFPDPSESVLRDYWRRRRIAHAPARQNVDTSAPSYYHHPSPINNVSANTTSAQPSILTLFGISSPLLVLRQNQFMI